MTSASEVGSVEKSTLSPPSTPPGYIKYYSRSIMADLSEKSIKEVLMVESGEEDDDDQLAILRPSSFDIQSTFTDGRKFFSITIKRRINRFCGFFLALFSFLFLIGFLVQYEAPPESPNQFQTMSNNHFGRHPLTLFSYVSRAWKTRENSTSPDTNTNKMRRLPQCIIIGARKCGTRALIDMLNLHPQVEKAALEVHFFDRDENYGQGLEWYRNHMPETKEDQICLEKSPSYFVTPEVPERIHGMNNSVKLLLIVREPVTRVISDYTQIYGTNSKARNGTSKSPRLEELVLHPDGSVNVHYKAVRISMYARYLQRWLDVFPLHQMHIIDGDALIRDPYPVLKDVERFLGLLPRLSRDNFYFNVTKGFYCWRKLENSTSSHSSSSSSDQHQVPEPGRNEGGNPTSTGLHCLNDSKGRRHPQVDMRIVSKLRRFYNPHNLRFYDMVSRDFGWPEQ